MKSIVAIEPNINTNEITRYYSDNTQETEIYHPWLISTFQMYANKGVVKTKVLNGNNPIKYRMWYKNMATFKQAAGMIRGKGGIVNFDWVHQYLAENPQYKLFQNMRFEDLYRVSIDIEATGLNAETDRILMIGVADSEGNSEAIVSDDEREMIIALNLMIQEANPDVIEGWNIYGYDLPFLETRAKKYGLTLDWGRDNSPVYKAMTKRFRVGSYTRPIDYYRCHGRHVLDGMLIAMRFDTNVGGNFETYGLKSVAKSLGVSEDNRIIVERGTMEEQWNEDRERIKVYCLQDCLETISVMNIIAQPDFYLTSVLPDMFQHITVAGGATKINQLLLSEYICNNESIPLAPTERESYEGGYVEQRKAGVFRNVAKVDVSSLYPSIMLSFNIVPPQDTVGSFRSLLSDITDKRLMYKGKKNAATTDTERTYYEGMEKAFKVVINSFYGYLGTTGMNFANFESASEVTRIGRGIVTNMADQLEDMGLGVIEIDTDGIYFHYDNGFDIDSVIDNIFLPDGIKIDIDKGYTTMVAIKAKNYVLVTDDEIKYHGNSIRSRKDEKFGKKFLESMIDRLIDNDPKSIYNIYKDTQKIIIDGKMSADDLARRERISDKTLTSPNKKRMAEAVSETELTEGEYIYVYQDADSSLHPIELFDGKYDKFYYLERLHNLAKRVETILSIYDITLPRMTKREFKEVVNGFNNNNTQFGTG